MPCCYKIDPGIIGYVVIISKVFIQWCIQTNPSFIYKFQNAIGKYRFAQGGSFKNGLRSYWLPGFGIHKTKYAAPKQFIVFDYSDTEAWNISFFHQARDIFFQFFHRITGSFCRPALAINGEKKEGQQIKYK